MKGDRGGGVESAEVSRIKGTEKGGSTRRTNKLKDLKLTKRGDRDGWWCEGKRCKSHLIAASSFITTSSRLQNFAPFRSCSELRRCLQNSTPRTTPPEHGQLEAAILICSNYFHASAKPLPKCTRCRPVGYCAACQLKDWNLPKGL